MVSCLTVHQSWSKVVTQSFCEAAKGLHWTYSPHLISMHHRALTEQVAEHLQRLPGLHRACGGCSSAPCALSGFAQAPSSGLVYIMCWNLRKGGSFAKPCRHTVMTCMAVSVRLNGAWQACFRLAKKVSGESSSCSCSSWSYGWLAGSYASKHTQTVNLRIT